MPRVCLRGAQTLLNTPSTHPPTPPAPPLQLECLPGTRGSAAAAGAKAAQEEGLPRPCCNAALAVSEDGERLWLSGGSAQGGRCQGTLWW